MPTGLGGQLLAVSLDVSLRANHQSAFGFMERELTPVEATAGLPSRALRLSGREQKPPPPPRRVPADRLGLASRALRLSGREQKPSPPPRRVPADRIVSASQVGHSG